MPRRSDLAAGLAQLPCCALAGCDEAGRGALAGPVYAAAVILPPACSLSLRVARRLFPGLADSKTLSAHQRAALAAAIKREALAWAVSSASLAEIEQLNILQAALLAMRRALDQLAVPPSAALIDGPHLPQLPSGLPGLAVVDGDAQLACIAAAGILAKVERDTAMEQLDAVHPGYGFAGHKGYAAPAHLAALERLGPCPAHRRSFKPVARLLDGLFVNVGP